MLHSKLLGIATSIILIFSMVLTGCDDGSTGSNPDMGTMEVLLHDAPANYEQVNVTVDSIKVNNAETDTGWVAISSPEQTYDLLELTNGETALLGSKQLPVGVYSQIRLVLADDGHNVVLDGTQHDLKVPSGSQSGVKLNIDAEIEENITYSLLLDFDASRSVVKRGNNQSGARYLLKPVISASSQAETGNIAGSVDPADAEPFVYALSNSDTLSSTKADTSSGDFELIGLGEGSYRISVDPTNEMYQITDTTGIEVTVGETTEIGTITLEQN